MTQTSTGLAKGAAAPESANGDRIGFGIGCALVGLFGMSVMDACAKLLGSGYAVRQVILARNGIGALGVVVFVDRKSVGVGTSVAVRVNLGGRPLIKKKNKTQNITR